MPAPQSRSSVLKCAAVLQWRLREGGIGKGLVAEEALVRVCRGGGRREGGGGRAGDFRGRLWREGGRERRGGRGEGGREGGRERREGGRERRTEREGETMRRHFKSLPQTIVLMVDALLLIYIALTCV